MKTLSVGLCLCSVLGAQTLAPPTPLNPETVVITIGQEKITRAQFEDILKGLPEQVRQMADSPEGRRNIAKQLAELKAMAQEARRRKLEETPKFRQDIALQMDQMLASAVMADMMEKNPIPETLSKKYFADHADEYSSIDARHILIRFQGSPVPVRPDHKDLTEEESLGAAKAVLQKIKAGGDFAALAKTESDDTQSGAMGGDLGIFSKEQMVGEFADAAFVLKDGEVSEPVKTQFGYHIIQVKKHVTKTFEEMKDEIESKLKPEHAQGLVKAVQDKAAIVIDEGYFGSAEPAARAVNPAP